MKALKMIQGMWECISSKCVQCRGGGSGREMNENKQGYLMLSVAGCHHGMLFSVRCFIWLSCHTPEPARLLQWR